MLSPEQIAEAALWITSGWPLDRAIREAALRAHGLDPRDWDSGLSPRGEPQLRRKVRGGGFVIVDQRGPAIIRSGFRRISWFELKEVAR
jgi:hypothetical protein